MTNNNELQPPKTTESEKEYIRIQNVLTKVLQDNLKILSMIEEILEQPQTEEKTHLDLLIDRIERGNNQ